ncbi:MAG: SDR family oxidoreductase [Actinomycetota bacterium]
MASTILITGSSTGIGRATAELFADRGWNVVATMRDPADGAALAERDNVFVTPLDVTDEASIAVAIQAAIDRFGSLDCLVNNAGYAAYGAIEATSLEDVRRQFDTNVVGLLAVTKAVLPHFRARSAGTVVNISSPAGKIGFPLGTLYCGSKHAVEGMSEAMSYELGAIGVRMRIVEPGAIRTDFATRSFHMTVDDDLPEYAGLSAAIAGSFATIDDGASPPGVVAEVIHAAVVDDSDQLRYTAGADAAEMIGARAAAGDEAFVAGLRARLSG